MKTIPQADVTHGMIAFSWAVVKDPRFKLGDWTAVENVDGVPLVGHVVIHDLQAATGRRGTFRACELYFADGAPEGAMHPAALAAAEPHPTGIDDTAQAHGIDVSDYQPGIDWAVAEPSTEVDFVFVKAHEYHAAKLFAEHWTKARDVGLPRGAYHFFRAGLDPRDQVLRFLETVADAEAHDGPAELGYVIDVESQTSKPTATAAEQLAGLAPGAFLDRVELAFDALATQTGGRRLAYCSPGFWGLLPPRGVVEARAELWIAAYRRTPPPPCGAWKAWRFWQRTDKQAIPGYAHTVDGNVFAGTVADLRAWCGTSPTDPAPTGDTEALGRLWKLADDIDHGRERIEPDGIPPTDRAGG